MKDHNRFSRRRFMQSTALTAGAAAAATLFPAMSAEAADEILVGGLHDLSGFLDFAGIPMNQIMLMAIEEINASGGLLGKQVKGVVYDPQSNMSLYSQYATQLALKDKVAVVMGGITSASRETIRPIFHRFKTLYFYNTLYEGGVCDRNEITLGTTPAQTVEQLVPHTMKLWGKKVYTLAADYNYGQITAAWVKRYVEQNGGEVVSTDFFPLDVTNFGPTISKIQAAKPDFVMGVLVGSAHLSFYRQWAAAGMKGKIPDASTTFGAGGNEVVPAESNGLVNALGYFQDVDTPANNAWRKKIEAFFPDKVPLLTELSCATYEGVHLWAKGVTKAGTTKRMPVIEALETGISFDGPSGKVTIDPKTHHCIRNVHLAVIEDRKWRVLETYNQVPPADTQAVCDLEKNPNDTTMYVIKQ